MADEKKKPRKRGYVSRLFFAISALSSLLLATALVFMLLPQDLHDIEGYGEGAQVQKARDLTAVLRESLDRGHEVTITEDELNRWIGQTLKLEQQGLLAGAVKINGLAIRLDEGIAEIVMVRSFFGLKLTLSMHMQVLVEASSSAINKEVLLHGDSIVEAFPPLKRGGRFGSLTVPQGYLYLVRPAFFQLGEVYKEEIGMIFDEMHDIRLEDGKVVFVPKSVSPAPKSP